MKRRRRAGVTVKPIKAAWGRYWQVKKSGQPAYHFYDYASAKKLAEHLRKRNPQSIPTRWTRVKVRRVGRRVQIALGGR